MALMLINLLPIRPSVPMLASVTASVCSTSARFSSAERRWNANAQLVTLSEATGEAEYVREAVALAA